MTTTITIELPDSITKRCAGRDVDVDSTRITATTAAWLLTYGLRVMGDSVNGAANAAKKAHEADATCALWVDADFDSAIVAVVASVYDGTVCVAKSLGVSDIVKEMRKIARDEWLASLPKGDRAKARAIKSADLAPSLDALIDGDADGYRTRAESAIAARKADAIARAKGIADAMTRVASANIDLDALLAKGS